MRQWTADGRRARWSGVCPALFWLFTSAPCRMAASRLRRRDERDDARVCSIVSPARFRALMGHPLNTRRSTTSGVDVRWSGVLPSSLSQETLIPLSTSASIADTSPLRAAACVECRVPLDVAHQHGSARGNEQLDRFTGSAPTQRRLWAVKTPGCRLLL